MTVTIELRSPSDRPRRLPLAGPIEVGREGDGIRLRDKLASRRHARLIPAPQGLMVEDLGSTHGTLLNGGPLPPGGAIAGVGDVIGIGLTDLRVLEVAAPVASPAPVAPAAEGAPGSATAPAALPDNLSTLAVDGASVAFVPGTAGQRFAPEVASTIAEARQWIAGVTGTPAPMLTVLLLDPFPHPRDPRTQVSSGAVVDGATLWMVATPESPPEHLHRWIALAASSSLQGGPQVGWLLEAYGLLESGFEPDQSGLAQISPPPDPGPLVDEIATHASAAFVGWLLERDGREQLHALISQARAGRVDSTAEAVYGTGLAKLAQSWQSSLSASTGDASLKQFVGLAWRMVKPYKTKELEGALHTLLSLAFTIAFPFAFRLLLDSAIPQGDGGQIVTVLIVLAVAFLVSVGGQVRRAYLGAFVGGAVVRDLRASMFGRLQHLSRGWYDRQDPGDLLTRFFSDVAQLEQGLTSVLREGSVQIISLIVASVVLLILQPILGAVVLIGAPAVAIVYKRMSAGALERSSAVQNATGEVLGVVRENSDAREVVTAFGLEDRERSRFAVVSERLRASELRLYLFTGLFGLSVNSILILLRLAVLGLGAFLILNDNLTIGGLVAFVSVMDQVLEPAAQLSQIGQNVQTSTGSLARIDEVLQAPIDIDSPETPATVPPLRQGITLEDVTFSYGDNPPTLIELSCTIPAGKRVAFVGPSGAGKSTVLRLLSREYDPQQGRIAIDGVDLRALDPAELRATTAVVFQRTFLFDTTLRENIRLGRPEATDAEVNAAAAAASLDASTFPDGLDSLTGDDGSRVSGGQGQRLAIARAILRDPRLLILDEATSALDPSTEREVAAVLADASGGRTVVAVTHRLTTIADFDKIVVLVAGRLAEEGTHRELLGKGGVYAKLWAEQTGESVGELRTAVDPAAVLAAIPAFSALGPDDLGAMVERMRADSLGTDESLTEQPGRLAIVMSGHASVLLPGGPDGIARVSADLEAGEVFGVGALAGNVHGALLRATEPTELLVLEATVLARLAGERPAIAEAVAGTGRGALAPSAGEVRAAASLTLV